MQNHKEMKNLINLSDNLVFETEKLLIRARNEEDLRIGFELILEPIKRDLGINSIAQYEKSIFKGRSDAIHGQIIIEYEPPNSLSNKKNVEHAFSQLVNYIYGESKNAKSNNYLGVGFDGKKIFFVTNKSNTPGSIKINEFILRGTFDFNQESARTFLIHLRSLSRRPLTAINLAEKFGPQSSIASKVVIALVNGLNNWGNQTHIRVFFDEWKRIFGIVYGSKFSAPDTGNEIDTLSTMYKISKNYNFQDILFSIHTYFALLMKLIAAELLTLRESSLSSSLCSNLTHSDDENLRKQLEDIESGGIYARKGIRNFLEGDFFRWYIDALDSPELKEAIREITRALSEFEPATSTIDPSSTHDLLKRLYQYLVPQVVRHRLGEYYTPDWLAELLLDDIGYDGNTLKRFLDPSCGSGTFLVHAIQRAIKHGKNQNIKDLEIAKRIIKNIYGFDLNPLAVIAARTNYIFSLGDLVNELESVDIPIYLTDSVLTPSRTSKSLFGNYLEVQTSVGVFQVPAEWVKQGGYLMAVATPLIEEMVRNRYSEEEAMTRLKKEGLVFSNNDEIVRSFYKRMYDLDKENKNGIWARFLKNVFAPSIAGKFDFVVGNPPWIRWDYLSDEYRSATLPLWNEYGLFSLRGISARLGGGKKDFSMLFVYAAADYYLKKGAKLGFLITQEVFKSKGAGEGFRRFQLGDNNYLQVVKAHDFTEIQPFEGATNKTAIIMLKLGEKTVYPVPYIVWKRKSCPIRIPTDSLLEDVLKNLKKEVKEARPIGSLYSSWQTCDVKSENNQNIGGNSNHYNAILGANPNPYGVFWLEVKSITQNGNLIISNLPEHGKLTIQKIEDIIENKLVYPAIRGSDIKRWGYEQDIFLLMVQNPGTREPYSQEWMKNNCPRTYNYLTKFKDILAERKSKTIKRLAERTEFYAMFGIEQKTVSTYKVVWKAMSNDIFASVLSSHKTVLGHKILIPLHTTAFFAAESESEAHYICSVINSNPVREHIKCYSSAGRGFGTPSIMEHVGIPKFDKNNPLHLQLCDISKNCHAYKIKKMLVEIEKLEIQNDSLVNKLFDL